MALDKICFVSNAGRGAPRHDSSTWVEKVVPMGQQGTITIFCAMGPLFQISDASGPHPHICLTQYDFPQRTEVHTLTPSL